MIFYAVAPYVFLYAVLVPTRPVSPPDVADLAQWGCNPYSTWSIVITGGEKPEAFVAPPLNHTGSTILDLGEQLVFARSFEGKQEEKAYVEISQRFTQPFDLHYVPERYAYCKFDDRGDIEDDIKIIRIPFDDPAGDGRLVTVRRDILDAYMTLTDQTLVLRFNSTRFQPKNFGGWPNKGAEDYHVEPEIWYHMGRSGDQASYIGGFQIIRSGLSNDDVTRRYGLGSRDNRQYATFLALDWKHKALREWSCDPKKLGNYFVEFRPPF